jgi:thiol-disulfide isomerase/thioredoxin
MNWLPPSEALARLQRRDQDGPGLLLWTADWCPPCHELKRRVLAAPSFQAAAEPLASIRIESEDPVAQAVADERKLHGYPTLVVYGEDGTEAVRLPPSGVPVPRYVDLIESARRSPGSVISRLVALRAGTLPQPEVLLLAWHYWGDDSTLPMDAGRIPILQSILQAADGPDTPYGRTVQARILVDAATTGWRENPALLSSFFWGLVSDEAAPYADLYELLVKAGTVIRHLSLDRAIDPMAGADALAAAATRTLHEPSLTRTDRLIALHAAVEVKTLTGSADTHLHERARAEIAGVESTLADPSERQTVLNMAGHLAWQLGDLALAEQVYRRGIADAAAPPYFMQVLARFLQAQGRAEEARDQLAQALSAERGLLARFSISAKRVELLVAQGRPAAEIGDIAIRALEEMESTGGGIRGRAAKTLEDLINACLSRPDVVSALAPALSTRLHRLATASGPHRTRIEALAVQLAHGV